MGYQTVTNEEYNSIRREKERSVESFKRGSIILCSALFVATQWLSWGECSDTVQSVVFGLNGCIWLLCVQIHDLKKEKNKAELDFLFTRVGKRIAKTDKWG